jgi:hypothetical protein
MALRAVLEAGVDRLFGPHRLGRREGVVSLVNRTLIVKLFDVLAVSAVAVIDRVVAPLLTGR